jgi:hypothetical protein
MERLSRYLSATGRDVPKALELYEYNVQLSEVLYGILHGLEVSVRNAWFEFCRCSAEVFNQIAHICHGRGRSKKPEEYREVELPLSQHCRDNLH